MVSLSSIQGLSVWCRCVAQAGFWWEWKLASPAGRCQPHAGGSPSGQFCSLAQGTVPGRLVWRLIFHHSYIVRYICFINVYSLIDLLWLVPKCPKVHSKQKPVVLYCCSPRVLREGPWRTLMKAVSFPLQSCLTLCDPIDGSPPGSAIPGILQARTLEQVATSFSNAWKWKMKMKSLSRVRLFATPWTAAYQAAPSMGFSRQEYWSGVPLPSPWRFPLPLVKRQDLFLFS